MTGDRAVQSSPVKGHREKEERRSQREEVDHGGWTGC